jgi:hypothetical protein
LISHSSSVLFFLSLLQRGCSDPGKAAGHFKVCEPDLQRKNSVPKDRWPPDVKRKKATKIWPPDLRRGKRSNEDLTTRPSGKKNNNEDLTARSSEQKKSNEDLADRSSEQKNSNEDLAASS